MRSRHGWAHSRAALSMVVVASSVSACAAIWGFEEGVPTGDAGASDDAEVDATAFDALAPFDGTLTEAAFDATTADRTPDDDEGGPTRDAPSDADGAHDESDAPSGPCTGVCVPDPVDPGWDGPFATFEVADGGGLPSCDAPGWAQAFDLNAGADASAAGCDCRCAPPANVTCGPPQAVISVDRACATACLFSLRTPIGACTSVPPPAPQCTTNARVSFAPGAPDGGSCVSTTYVDASPIGWSAKARLCAPQASPGSCITGTCVPSDPSADPITYCVTHPGTVPCPGAYPALHAYGDGGTPYISDAGDSRSCSCSCGAPTGLACTSRVALFDSGTCIGAGAIVEAGTCGLVVPAEFASGTSSPADAGSCAPFGTPTGGLALTDSYTVCCTR